MKASTLFAPAVLAAALSFGHAANAAVNVTLQPDEASSEDVFIYEFGIDGVFGIPAPRRTNLDTTTLSALNPPAAVPFGNFLGTADTDPRFGDGGVERAHDTKTLIRFDLGLLNLTSAGVASATINLYGVPSLSPFESPSAEHPATTEMFRVLEAWNESSVTWETAPMTAMTASSSTVQNSVNSWVSFDATALVRSWLDNPSSNYGVLLAQRDVVEFDVDGNSRYVGALYASSASADASMRPFLQISAVPEPSSVLMMGAGLGLLLVARRRRNRA
ncbi:DNRLRE domain-containing protein [Methyloversatilis sp.]|uniref:DNRLRE domain-containing protein n=1 Tax=Methyloversatilis sp. TaxID=2569862 RepID=UPI0027366B42|nr:DNRLRE domain-containing protein [Methyloversatilis sp.]MDP2869563.1 DNRLRE domain-containing protein [Methyloversatilis sp.]MDP3456124.1 DNRLRE domain-containing protein [Methyloversatilis sp.]MDP3577377.1 DNRLRE domain-containing protein [Methyloversatilis sp.]